MGDRVTHLPSILQLVGMAVLVAAGFVVAPLVGLIASGVALLVLGVLLERPAKGSPDA